jgi:phage terminase large subunit-like protein
MPIRNRAALSVIAVVAVFATTAITAQAALSGTNDRAATATAKPNFTFGPVKKNKRKGTAKLYVNVPGPGDLALEGTGRSKSDTERANSQGSVFLNVKPNAKGKRKLRNKGKLTVNAVVTYTEDNGQPETEATSVTLKLKRKG